MAPAPNNTLDFALHHLTLTALGNDVAAVLEIWIPVLALGLVVRRVILRRGPSDAIADGALVLGTGITSYGMLLVALGFAPILHRVPLTALTVVCALPLFWVRRDGAWIARQLGRSVATSLRRDWAVAVPGTIFFLLVLLACFRPPFAADEVAYHWAAPVVWAHAGHWITSPYRFTNGFNLAESIYTTAAVWHAPTAAHWTSALTLGLLALATAAICRRYGGPGVLAAVATLAIPAASTEGWLAYNDVFGASLVMVACVAIAERSDSRSRWLTGILLAGAISVKPLLILLAPLPILLAVNAERERSGRWRVADQIRALLPLAVPGALASCGWFAYSLFFTGKLFEKTGTVVAIFGRDPTHGLATIRIPDLLQILAIPVLPMATAIIGNREPYGNRSSLVLLVFLPVVIVTVVRMTRRDRNHFARLALPTAVTYLIAACLVVRTRYLIVFYCAALAAAAVTVEWWLRHRPKTWGRYLHVGFEVLTILGLLDAVRHFASA